MMTPRPDRFTYPADKARQGEVVLTRPWMRVVFIVGIVACAALAVIAWAYR